MCSLQVVQAAPRVFSGKSGVCSQFFKRSNQGSGRNNDGFALSRPEHRLTPIGSQ